MNSRKLFLSASWAMIITGLIHLIGHFSHPELSTDDEKTLFRLMNELQFEMDPWFSRSVYDLFDAFSLFLTVMLLTLGSSNLTIIRSSASQDMLKRVAGVQSVGIVAMLGLSIFMLFLSPLLYLPSSHF